jgi:hypothetical protein
MYVTNGEGNERNGVEESVWKPECFFERVGAQKEGMLYGTKNI